MRKLTYLLCIVFTLPVVPFVWSNSAGEGADAFIPAFCFGLLIIFLVNWLLNLQKPMEEIFRNTLKSCLVVLIAYSAIFFIFLLLFLLTIQAGWWNR